MASAERVVVKTTYRGFPVTIDRQDIMVTSPDGDIKFCQTMSGVRLWVKRKRRELGMPGSSWRT